MAQPNSSKLQWVLATNGTIPSGAVLGGRDLHCDIYVGRVRQFGELIPGKVVPVNQCCYIPFDGKELANYTYEVLTRCNAKWVTTSGSKIMAGAIQAGNTRDREVLYVGRVYHEDTLVVGKVHPSHGKCYISYRGREYAYDNYEILTEEC